MRKASKQWLVYLLAFSSVACAIPTINQDVALGVPESEAQDAGPVNATTIPIPINDFIPVDYTKAAVNNTVEVFYGAPTDTNDTDAHLDSRGLNACSFSPYQKRVPVFEKIQDYTITGAIHQISNPICPPASIAKSETYTYSHSITTGANGSLKLGDLVSLGITASFGYTWGRSTATGYTVTCNDIHNGRPCIETFQPTIGVIKGWGYTQQRAGSMVCSTSAKTWMEIHVPVTKSADCQGPEALCPGAGVYDSCYYVGNVARSLCPRNHFGPVPKNKICLPSLYPNGR